ncbi:hypothetical protein C0989_004150 [Termitomyces sp. Mn162]|nr:hypothetical protein C0989_004150 [Termitomyces sp. Mn162]
MHSLTSTPNRPKRAFPPALPSARRASTGTAPSAPHTPSLPIKTTPRPSTSASTGIPAFRSLRSLLPFGPSKHATPASPAVPPTPNASKNPFHSFGSVRRSMQKGGKVSLDVELPPVISIDQVTKNELEGNTVRKASSCSMLQPIDGTQGGSSNSFQDEDDTAVFFTRGTPILRTPSPGPPISAELSTILEADSSGISKHIPSSKNPSRAPSPDISAPVREESHVIDTFVLDLSTTHLEDQVLGAMRSETSSKPQEWNVADQAIIIDADGDNSDSLNLNALDPDLAAILSPHSLPAHKTTTNVKSFTLDTPQRTFDQPVNFSNGSPQSVLAPSPIISGDSKYSPLNPLHLRLPRQQSSLPRLRPPISPVSPSPHSSHSPSPSTVGPSSSASDSTFRGEDARKTNLASPLTLFSPTSFPPSPATAVTIPKTISSPLSSSTASMTSFFSRRFSTTKTQSSVSTLVALQPASSSTISQLRTPFTQMPHPGTQRRPSSSEADIPDVIRAITPSSTSKLASRPSLDSPRESGGFDRPRPSLSSDTHIRSTRPSLDTLRGSAADTENARTASAALERVRKRSLSVQDRLTGRHTLGGSKSRGAVEADHKGDVDGITEFGEQRPSSSQSMRMNRRWGGRRAESTANGSAPVTEWLGPRTVKAFKAAGLLDFERDQQPPSDRNGPASLSSSVGPNHGRFGSTRSTSEYNPRAPSRLAVSEAGGSSRRGSVSGTHGLMESPTFTASSGSRDTPRSVSTAPTSVSGSSFAFLGRDRDREREEIRELKDKHASETEALLGALSDSQRTTRLLREENGEIRDRLEQAKAEIDALRRVVGELTKETGDLRVQIQMLKSTPNMNSRRGAVTRQSRITVPLHIEQDDDDDDNKWSNPVNGKKHDKLDVTLDSQQSQNPDGSISDTRHHPDFLGTQGGPAVSSSTPVAPKHKRRFSTTSSIFPVPPANMTMLLHDHDYDQDSGSLNDSLDHSQSFPSAPTPLAPHDDTITRNTSLTSAISISPTTANFSMTTGSPASLFLRPEHELHLGDMDSLDLGTTRNPDVATQNEWSE